MYILNININNTDECIKCSALIDSIMNNKNKVYDNVTILSIMGELKCSLVSCDNSNLPFSKYEEPIRDGVFATIPEELNESTIKNYCSNNLLHFHIRVHFNIVSDYVYSHSIALLIIKYKELIKNKLFSMFLVPTTGDVYPFLSENGEIETNTFEEFSYYLSCLLELNHGIVYGINHKKQDAFDNVVKSLQFRRKIKKKNIFPVLIFKSTNNNNTVQNSIDYVTSEKIGNAQTRKENEKNFENVNNFELFFNDALYLIRRETKQDLNILSAYLDIVFKIGPARRFGFSDSDKPNVAICDYIFETAYYNLREKFEEYNLDLYLYENIIKEQFKYANIFSFIIFAFIFHYNPDESRTIELEIKKTSKLSIELSISLKQLIENSLQHSDKQIAVVSFNITEDNLNIILSDFSNHCIIDTFSEKLEKEKQFVENEAKEITEKLNTNNYYNSLLSVYQTSQSYISNNDLYLDCFFNDFKSINESTKTNWNNYRKLDSSAHIGLALFANVINKCNGKFTVSSIPDYCLKEEVSKNTYSNTNDAKSSSLILFPGTCFVIHIPIKNNIYTENYSIAKLRNQYFNENYESYKSFFNYKEREVCSPSQEIVFKSVFNDFIRKYSENQIVNYDSKKFVNCILWTNYWLAVFDKISITECDNKFWYIIDFKNIFRNDYNQTEYMYEVFVKGLINALGIFFNKCDMYSYFAINNATKQFIDMFIKISTLLAIKDFPNNLQLFIVDDKNEIQLHLFGNNYFSAIRNSYFLSLENGVIGYDGKDYYSAESLLSVFKIYVDRDQNDQTLLFPFSSMIKKNNRNLFFERIKSIAEKDITSGNGYKFINSHTRIGNKVHIDAFYEMSYLFYRTIMANNVAFYILNDLNNLKDINGKPLIDLKNDTILFYGYASYSQAILTSLTNILNGYSNDNNGFYASYLYNSPSDNSLSSTTIHINNKNLLDRNRKKLVDMNSSVKVIQIVPISSTMTTFSKMWAKFESENNRGYELFRNYTVFWVRDNKLDGVEREYCDIPGKYSVTSRFKNLSVPDVQYILTGNANWSKPELCPQCFPINVVDETPLVETDQTSTVPSQQVYLKNTKKIESVEYNNNTLNRLTSLLGFVYYGHFKRGKNHYQYYIDTQKYFNLVSENVKKWLDSARKRDLLNEEEVTYPCLDIIFSPVHKSNVSFAQYVNSYYYNGTAEIISVDEDKVFRSNFICEHNELKNIIERITDDYYDSRATDDPHFKPVRFTFVDDNLISGETFRKASSLLQSLLPNRIVKNYTTNIFDKCFVLINRLSYSTIKSYIIEKENFYAFCQIDISNMRTQGDSCVGCKLKRDAERFYKRSSTQQAANYWSKKYNDYCSQSFEQIENSKISKNDAFMRMIVSHLFKNYINEFDNSKQNYFDLIVAFINAAIDINYIDNNDTFLFENQKAILSTCRDLIKLRYDENSDIIENIDSDDIFSYRMFSSNLNVLKCIIKIISRPFFTFNQNIKTAVLKLIIILSETIINQDFCLGQNINNNASLNAIKLLSHEIMEELCNDNLTLIKFLQDCLFEALSDLKSTYLIREKTIINTLRFFNRIQENAKNNEQDKIIEQINNFYSLYSIFVQKVVDSGADETRALWLENLLIKGVEKNDNENSINEMKTSHELFLKEIKRNEFFIQSTSDVQNYFIHFCDELFLSNGIVLYDGIERLASKNEELSEDYFMDRWKAINELDCISNKKEKCCFEDTKHENKKILDSSKAQISLYKHLKNDFSTDNELGTNEFDRNIIDARYESLLRMISDMIAEKHHIHLENIHIALITYYDKSSNNTELEINDIRNLEIVKYNLNNAIQTLENVSKKNKKEALSNYIYLIKKIILNEETRCNGMLNQYGYSIQDNTFDMNHCYSYHTQKLIKNKKYIVLKFDNNKCEAQSVSNNEIKKIVPVYIFVNIEANNDELYMIMRDILIYRNSLMYYFQEDFTSDVMQRYAKSLATEAILENEKVVSHSPLRNDEEELKLLINPQNHSDCENQIETIIMEWVIARNYCNTVIARLYNRVFRNIGKEFKDIVNDDISSDENTLAYKLYVNKDNQDGRNIPFISLEQLQQTLESDSIYELFKEIIDFKWNYSHEKSPEAITKSVDNKSYVLNLVFLKNIIYRTCLDALRFSYGSSSEKNSFISRIKQHYVEKKLTTDNRINNDSFISRSKASYFQGNAICAIDFDIELCENSKSFDWFVIKNYVKKSEVLEHDKNYINYLIMKMDDPLDFADGHMSLITAKEYFLRLVDENDEDRDSLHLMYQYDENCFITRLPILKKEYENEQY